MPYLLLAWMPYRLPNHLTTLLVPATLATAIGWPEADARRWIGVGSAGLAAVLALAAGPLQVARVTMGLLLQIPYTESILFALFGAAAASTLLDVLDLRRWVVPWSALWAGAVLGAALGFRGCLVSSVGEPYQAGWSHYPWVLLPASLLIGFILAVALEGRRFPGAGSKIAGVLCVVAVAVPTVQEWNRRDHLPVSDFERRIVEHLAERGEGPVMILAPHQQQSLQTRLGQPVMTDMGGFNWIPYKPSVGPSHYKMYLDLFGINFAPGPGEPAYPGPHWSAFPERYVWGPRPRAEWQRLGEEYGIDYVISPSAVPLDLPLVLEGGGFAFYRIPDRGGSGS